MTDIESENSSVHTSRVQVSGVSQPIDTSLEASADAGTTPIPDTNLSNDTEGKQNTSKPSQQIKPGSRTSERKQNEGKVAQFSERIESQSQYHDICNKEIQDPRTQANYERLAQIKQELEQSICTLHSEFKQLTESISSTPKNISIDIDRLTRDSDQLQDKVSEHMNKLSVRKRTTTDAETTESVSMRSTNTKSSKRSSSSSMLRMKAQQARAEEEAKKAQLAALTELEDQEMELAALKAQQELEMAKRRRELERIRLQGEIAAEKRRREVLEQAVDEEENEKVPLMRPPSVRSLPNKAQPQLQDISTPPLHTDDHRLQTENLNQSQPGAQGRECEEHVSNIPTSHREPQQLNDQATDKSSSLQVVHNPNSHRLVPPSPQHNSDQTLLAEAIMGAIDHSIENHKLETPKPHIYTGELQDYPDWRAAINRYIRDRQGKAEDKLALLRSYLSPEHHKLINAYCTIGTDYAWNEALKALDEEFGDQFQIGKSYKLELHEWPRIPANDGPGLKKYLGFLKQCASAMEKIKTLKELNGLSEQQRIIKKLPAHLERKWIGKTTKFYENNGKWPALWDLCQFLQYEVKVACNPLNDSMTANDNRKTKQTTPRINRLRTAGTPHGTSHSYNTATTSESKKRKSCINCQKDNHFTSDCGYVKRMDEKTRQKFISENKLCFYCLNPGHGCKECKTPLRCLVSGCGKAHATVNHHKVTNSSPAQTQRKHTQMKETERPQPAPRSISTHSKQSEKQPPPTQQNDKAAACHSIRSSEEIMSMLIMPVHVSYKKGEKEVMTYALIDSMSDRSFISENLVEQLEVSPSDAVKDTMTIHTMTQSADISCTEISGLKIRGYNEGYTVNLPSMITTSAREIPINRNHIPNKGTVDKWKHLRCISNKLPPPMNIDVGILLGANCNPAHVPLEIVANSPEEPYAKRTVLGWSVTGNHHISTQQTNSCYSHRIITKKVQDDSLSRQDVKFICEQPTPSSQQILDILESDFQPTKEVTGLSIDDQLFMTIMNKNVYQDPSGYITTPLPFKRKPKNFGAISKRAAEHRFNLLLKRFQRDPDYEQKYKEFMKSIIDQGDAEVVEDDKDDSWYIPHFGVFHPKKPQKIRVVFDCAAKVQGKSLNDHLLQGPDLLNSMLGILMRFRGEKIAISCDIERMFHQFRVETRDRDYLRFLWMDESGQRVTFRMKVHLFGARSSPACATFGLRHLSQIYGTSSSAQEFITTNFYVDDGLTSIETVDKALSLVNETITLCRKGNVRLHKFISNSTELLANIPESERNDQNNTNLINTDEAIQRTLGIQWNTLTDVIQYKPQMPPRDLTRRGMLSTIASIFDPLGLISPILITGKLLLQQCCKRKLSWDEELPLDIRNKWICWIKSLNDTATLEFPRSYKSSDFGKPVKAELHSFSDASKEAYGAAVYLRLVNEAGNTSVNLVHAKARVAPSNVVSIPRLELQAAVLTATLNELVERELTSYKIDRSYYYTDSQIVLGYLNNEAKRFQTFVANRVQKIRNMTDPMDWFYVPTKLNPADHASRGIQADKLEDCLWLKGPSFLSEETLRLPEQTQQLSLEELKDKTGDVTARAHVNVTKTDTQTSLLQRLSNFSSWTKITRLVATMEQYKRYLCHKYIHKLELKSEVEAQRSAENTVIKLLQTEHLSSEVASLKQDKIIDKHSVLYKLEPFLDDDGIIRVGGRLEHSQYLEFKDKHPVVLPKSHITSTIITHYHNKTGHQGRRSTIGQLRLQGYWIIGGRAMVTSAINKCVTCKKLRATPQGQKMASLPSKRIEATPPFTYVGCDIFGPFLVRDRRSDIKRYGAIFTCMASKAIHIELVDDLTTDAFLNALRCIIAIRGPIRQLHTDRGTNFIGAANELHQQLGTNNSLSAFATENTLEFVTNVPYASHMGGIWERQIRSIRSVMNGLLKGHNARLDSTSLRTLFYEIMAVINCRPLTGTDDGLPLHPNMLLTLKSSLVLPPPGDFDETDIYSRKRWRRVQGMASEFWRRWKSEYVQTLQERQKWNDQKPNLKIGDIVLLKDSDTPRNSWPLGRITDVMPSKDNLVRKVKVQTTNRNLDHKVKGKYEQALFERPAHKVILVHRPEQTDCK